MMRNPFARQRRLTIPEFSELGLDNAIILIGHALEGDGDQLALTQADWENVELRITCSALAVYCAGLIRSIDDDDPRQVLQDIALHMAAHIHGVGIEG